MGKDLQDKLLRKFTKIKWENYADITHSYDRDFMSDCQELYELNKKENQQQQQVSEITGEQPQQP